MNTLLGMSGGSLYYSPTFVNYPKGSFIIPQCGNIQRERSLFHSHAASRDSAGVGVKACGCEVHCKVLLFLQGWLSLK